jgi:hypothetical protein
MKKNWLAIGFVPAVLLLLTLNTYANGPKAKPFIPDIPKTWAEIDPADEYPDFTYNGLTPSCAACPNCDPKFVFYVKGGTTNNLVVYFQGGGACWDTMNCLYVPTYYEDVPPLYMFANTAGMGIFDTENPMNPFKDWTFVYIPYCTGAVSVKIIVARSQAARADVCFLLASAGGFSQTSATGCQLRILPLQRSGYRALASSYTSRRAARMSCSCPPCRWQGVTKRMAL